jgi:hypothetical protein
MDAIERIGEATIKMGILDLSWEVMLRLWDPDPGGELTSVRQPFQDLSKRIGLGFLQLAIKLLVERSYWVRTWIAQELSVASALVIACGSKRLQFRQLAAGFLFLPLHRFLISKSLVALVHDEQDPRRNEEKRKVFQDLNRNRETGAPCHLIGSRNRYQKQRPDYRSLMLELLSLFNE